MTSFKRKFISWLNLDAWLKPYIDMNIDLGKKEKIYCEKDFKLMNNTALG